MAQQRPSFAYQSLIALIGAFMVGSMLSTLTQFWRMQITTADLTIYSAGAILVSWLCWRLPWMSLVLLAGGGAGSVMAWRRFPEFAAYVNKVADQWHDLWAYLRTFQFEVTFGPALGEVFVIALGLAVALLIITETLTEGTTFWTIIVGLVIFGSQWAWYFDQSLNGFMIYSVLAFALWVIAQAARRDARWAGSGRRVGYRSHITSPLVWVLIAAMTAAIFPSDFSPADLGRIGQKLQQTFPVLKQLRGAGVVGGRFSLASTGFSPEMGRLGGPIRLDHTPALALITENPLDQTAYLRGATYTAYTGQTWLSGEPNQIQIPPGGALATGYSSDVPWDYVTYEIRPLLNMGGTIFNMLEPLRAENLQGELRADADGNLWSDRSIAKGATYKVSSRIPTFSADQIRRLSTSKPADTYKAYLQVPATLPRRVGEMARQLTADKAHPYDKAVALEQYFRSLNYDLSPPSTPPGRDFVDYFLEIRRGYCVYSATAMAVMLRELGIPSRMVEGFAVPPSADYSSGSVGSYSYTVQNSQAHAWVEAYFPGYGWVTFEPTPRADLPGIDRSAVLETSSSELPVTDGGETPDLPDPNELPEDPGGIDGGAGTSTSDGGKDWPWAVTAGLALLAALALVYRRLRAEETLTASDKRQVVLEVWDKTDTLMGRFDFGRKPEQTPQEYARTLAKSWPDMEQPVQAVANDYTVARYAPPDHPVDPEASARARSLWRQIHERLLARYGWRMYLWRRLGRLRKRKVS